MEISITLNIRAPVIEEHLAALVAALVTDPEQLKAMREKLADKSAVLAAVLNPTEGVTP
jgi:DNA-binding transcriptional regulator YiaG